MIIIFYQIQLNSPLPDGKTVFFSLLYILPLHDLYTTRNQCIASLSSLFVCLEKAKTPAAKTRPGQPEDLYSYVKILHPRVM